MNPPARFLRRSRVFLRFFARRLYNRWDDDSVYFSAAAISFNILVTVLPLGLLLVTLSGFAMQGSGELRDVVSTWLADAGPIVPDTLRTDVETSVFYGPGAGITGVVGLLTLFWLVSRLFGTIRTAFDRIFDVPSGRNPILGKLFDFFLALLVSFSLLSAFLMTTLASLVRESTAGQIAARWPIVGSLIGTDSARLLGSLFTLLLLFILYWAAPNRRVSFRQAATATVTAALLALLGTRLYLWTIAQPDWGLVYGSLARAMATFLWLYWISVILLAAAEISQIIHEWLGVRRTLRSVEKSSAWLETVAE